MGNEEKICHTMMWRITLWEFNRNMDETLTEELFVRYYGGSYGSHFFSKWKYYDYSFMKMVGYFGNSTQNGQKFCDMVYEQMIKYEQRNKDTWK